MFSIRALKRRDGFTLDVAIEVSTSGVVGLFGRSGCGKTTLVNIVAGLLAADEAHVEIDGVVLEDSRSNTRLPALAMDRASDVRRIWPPPSPCEPSTVIQSFVAGIPERA